MIKMHLKFFTEDKDLSFLKNSKMIFIVRKKRVNEGEILDVSGDRVLIRFKYKTGGTKDLNTGNKAVWFPKNMLGRITWNDYSKAFISDISK